jgi:hypothetical protein
MSNRRLLENGDYRLLESGDFRLIELPPLVPLSDTFTDTNGTDLASHTMDEGPGWTELAANWEIDNNKAKIASGAASDWTNAAVANAGQGDGVVEVDVTVANYPALVFRAVDANNQWKLVLRTDTSKWMLYNIEAGSPGIVASGGDPVAASSNHSLKVILNGTSIKCYVDDVLVHEEFSSIRQYASLHGIGSYGGGDQFDNFNASESGAEEPPEGITGTLNATIDNLTLAFTGYINVVAGHNGVISDVTLSSNIQVSTQATLSQTLNNLTLQSTAVASATVNLNQTIDNLTLVSNVVFDFEAVLNATIDPINLSSSLVVINNANLNVTIDNITLVGTITDGSTPSRVYPIFGSSIFV